LFASTTTETIKLINIEAQRHKTNVHYKKISTLRAADAIAHLEQHLHAAAAVLQEVCVVPVQRHIQYATAVLM
jgi:hypothetical protein